MIAKIQELKEQYVNANSEQEREEINKKISLLSKEKGFSNAMVQSLEDSISKAKKLNHDIKVREQLESILEVLPLSYIAKNYFKKSRSWLYQRINEYNINGKPAQFSKDEITIFNNALQDISKKISSIQIR